jgi:hypothetical protein
MAVITIATITVPGWRGNQTGVSLRIYANADFTAEAGTFYPRSCIDNPASLGMFYTSVPCTFNGTNSGLVIPQIFLDSTTDSPDNPSATYSAVIWDGISGKKVQHFGTFTSFILAPSPTSTTWAAIFSLEAPE